jgi:hypothetical protein
MSGRRRFGGAMIMATLLTHASAADPNYDEAAVRSFALPDVLAGPHGAPQAGVGQDAPAAAHDWMTRVRPHQFDLLERFVYGRRLPPVPVTVVEPVERVEVDLGDGLRAVRIQARLRFETGVAAADRGPPQTEVLLYVPAHETAVPVFLELNFKGNQAQHPDPGIRLASCWLRDAPDEGIRDHRATEASRGVNHRRWPVEAMLGRGYGMATACYGDFFPDTSDGRPASVLPALGRPAAGPLDPDEPGAIAAWAWGLSRILDWLVTLPEVDPTRVIVVGHSRLGKTALWAGACDERFAMVVSNNSGCGGAALSRRNYGETVGAITSRFPHWFCPAFAGFADREIDLATDQHALLAMTAPRPLYVASASEDRWADPRGEFLAAAAAGPVWRLFGLEGLGTDVMPPEGAAIGVTIGYHMRPGGHDLLEFDWQRFADFADRTIGAEIIGDGSGFRSP